MTTNNIWLFEGTEFGEDQDVSSYVGFIYKLTNLETGKKYIGKKTFWTPKVSQKKNKQTGKVKKTRTKVPSDWREYVSSNDEIKAEAASGVQFKKEILHLCKSKAEMTYYETKFQFEFDVLLSDDYYNGWIMCRVRKAHLKSLRKG
jgi:hypothetical protein